MTNSILGMVGIYLLTPSSIVLFEQLTGLQLVKIFHVFYGYRKLITTFSSARLLSLTCAGSIQSIPPHLTSWRSISILSSHLRLCLPSYLLTSCFPKKTLYTPLLSPYALHVLPISFFSILSPELHMVSSKNYQTTNYVIFSIPLLPRPS